ncbi:MAG: hypothetical protein NC489_19460 [Ruminococcus flavefaciens]|nr:hypothetical protein [Ruminococcus flavefaciens]
MVVNGKDRNYKTMFCKCGCGNGVILKADNDKDFGVSLQLVSDNFYSTQNGLYNFLEKIKRIWYIIKGKEYCYFDILVNPKELQEFKEFVSRL